MQNRVCGLVLAAVFLAGCSYGVTEISFARCPAPGSSPGVICEVSMKDGKERGIINLSVVAPDGSEIHYQAWDIRAFEGQKIAADAAARTAGTVAGAAVKALAP
ncbi:MAG: hypothetical protein A3G18_10325 [Rhodospirillales bacterium RIFCSPLOWO2_12_FULL_58_28]|nr:MAG: hypothetical protein A3H92_08500 [Rhodospirillales bacterium RIFCSPLOWO2_02_FULL_58_16]OHC77674.1 MAG: hypothetical protein A3G18_10325 [Rhodospirillales bacterium RIFCSPLOWO2_12_FULL_58_28]